MGRLRTEEVRRLLRYLSERLEDSERLAEIEDALRDEWFSTVSLKPQWRSCLGGSLNSIQRANRSLLPGRIQSLDESEAS